jgi:hypothetical protein
LAKYRDFTKISSVVTGQGILVKSPVAVEKLRFCSKRLEIGG